MTADRHWVPSPFTSRRVGPAGLAVCVVFAAIGCLPATGLAADQGQDRDTASEIPDAGFWPTRKMTEAVLLKGVAAITQQYGLDESQRAAVEEDFLTRYPALLKRNRAVLQPIVNEFLEMQFAGETPTAERVAQIAKRVEPVLDDVRRTLRGTRDAIAPVLRPEQRQRWNRDFVKVWAGLAVVDTQVRRWKQGLYKPGDLKAAMAAGRLAPGMSATTQSGGSADDVAADRSSNRFKTRSKRPESEPAEPADVPLDKWQTYVKRFIRKHKLDAGQSNQAAAILKDVRKRAKDYNQQNQDLYDRIRAERKHADPDRRAELDAHLADLLIPLRDLFEELRARLDGVLRSDQR